MTMWGARPESTQPPLATAPVVPGSSGAIDLVDQPSPVVVRRPRWVVPALAAMGVVTLASVTVAVWALVRGPAVEEPAVSAGPTLRDAHESCGSKGDLADGGRTLDLDMKGEEFGSGELTWAEVKCYLNALKAPAYVVRHMESTRALDGRQSDTWGSFEASWTYHPDDGLDVLIRQVA